MLVGAPKLEFTNWVGRLPEAEFVVTIVPQLPVQAFSLSWGTL
jgi:hypothetical protein